MRPRRGIGVLHIAGFTLVQCWGLGAVVGEERAGLLLWLCCWLVLAASWPEKRPLPRLW